MGINKMASCSCGFQKELIIGFGMRLFSPDNPCYSVYVCDQCDSILNLNEQERPKEDWRKPPKCIKCDVPTRPITDTELDDFHYPSKLKCPQCHRFIESIETTLYWD